MDGLESRKSRTQSVEGCFVLTGGACPKFSCEDPLLFRRRDGGCWYIGGYLG